MYCMPQTEIRVNLDLRSGERADATVSGGIWMNGALLRGKNYYAYPPYDDVPKEGKFDWGGFLRNIAIGFVVVAVCVAAAVVTTGGGARDRNIGLKRGHHGGDRRKIPAYEQAAGRPYRYDAQYG